MSVHAVNRWPSYVPADYRDRPVIRYVWDDWVGEDAFLELEDDELMERIETISHRANLALAVSCAEWIVYRYCALDDDVTPYKYIDALWAAVVDDRYAREWQPDRSEWSGPVRGPMMFALLYVQEAVREMATEAGVGGGVLYLSALARQVLPDPQVFIAWRDQTIAHLQRLYPLDDADTLGDVIPREALIAPAHFDTGQTEPLVRRFLASLDWRTNEWLNTPDEMAELDFDGTAYDFDMRSDRLRRQEW
jgi:hypothetical protein